MKRTTTRKPPRRLLRELLEPIHSSGVTYQQQWIQCGKETCDAWHGPYWYAFFKTPVVRKGKRLTGGRTRSKYIGRELPSAIVEEFREQSITVGHITREARREIRRRKKR